MCGKRKRLAAEETPVNIAILWIWTIAGCALYEASEGNNKLVWILIIIFTGLIGALLYFFVRRPQRIQELGR
jgi:hypothetical protein